MRWAPLALVLAAGALGCGGNETSRRARLWTLFDIAALADAGESVAAGMVGFPQGIPTSYFISPGQNAAGGPDGTYHLTVSSGFVDGQVMAYATTELWADFDQVWAQPLYRALTPGGEIDDPDLSEPWVFGVGRKSLFYSPFWETYGFHAPEGVDVTTLLDTRAVVAAAGDTGGLRRLDGRITSLAPLNVFPNSDYTEYHYYDDTAAWDGVGGHRYIDFGTGRFDVDRAGVVVESPIFIFTRRNADGELEPIAGWPTVGGTRPLFSSAPVLPIPVPDAGADAPRLPPDSIEPRFGGLWRMYTVELTARAGLTADMRVLFNARCVEESVPCQTLDSQSAIETMGRERIQRTSLLATCPMLGLGSVSFPRTSISPPRPFPASP